MELSKELQQELNDMRHRQKLMLMALRNILDQNNKNGVNDYLIEILERAI